MDVSVGFFIFNRPDTTAKVFAAISAAKPRRLFVIADGPRNPEEQITCEATRSVTAVITWECDVRRLYSQENLGCRRRISSGLDWIFEQTESAIILEDDCLPHPSFFQYAATLLVRYANNHQVTSICGSLLSPLGPSDSSYFFSRYCFIWGWATWARAWHHYSKDLDDWPDLRSTDWLLHRVNSRRELVYWKKYFDLVHSRAIDTWDYQWVYSQWKIDGLSIVPSHNLVENIGFDERATHTKSPNALANRPSTALPFPLCHPPLVSVETEREKRLFEQIVSPRRPFWKRLVGFIGRMIS